MVAVPRLAPAHVAHVSVVHPFGSETLITQPVPLIIRAELGTLDQRIATPHLVPEVNDWFATRTNAEMSPSIENACAEGEAARSKTRTRLT